MTDPQNERRRSTDHIETKLEYIAKDIHDVKVRLDAQFVTKDQMDLVKSDVKTLKGIVFGGVAMVLTSFMAGVVALVMRGK